MCFQSSGVKAVPKRKIYFEQIPVKVVKKILAGAIRKKRNAETRVLTSESKRWRERNSSAPTSEADASNLEQPMKEKWQILCEQISVEHDNERLTALIEELNRVLQAREERTNRQKKSDRAIEGSYGRHVG